MNVRCSQCLHKLARYRFPWRLCYLLPSRIHNTGDTEFPVGVLLPEKFSILTYAHMADRPTPQLFSVVGRRQRVQS